MTDFINIGNTVVRCAVFGQGTIPCLILPGVSPLFVTDRAEAVRQQYGALLNRFTFYLIDRRDTVTDGFSIKDIAEDTAQILRHYGVLNACVFGASQGGMAALQLTADHPELVCAVAVASTASYIPPLAREKFDLWYHWSCERNGEALQRSFWEWLYSPAFLSQNHEAVAQSKLLLTPEQYDRFAGLIKAFDTLEVGERLQQIRCPVLVIAAQEDSIFPVHCAQSLAADLHTEPYIYRDYAHAVYDEAPDFPERLCNFFETYYRPHQSSHKAG